MSAENPAKALEALLPATIPIEGTNECVRPFTLALFAVLDRIGSPLLLGATPEGSDALSLLPSLYAVCRGARAALASKNLLLDAAEWADALPPTALSAIRDAAGRQIAAFLDVAPQGKKDGGTSGITAG